MVTIQAYYETTALIVKYFYSNCYKIWASIAEYFVFPHDKNEIYMFKTTVRELLFIFWFFFLFFSFFFFFCLFSLFQMKSLVAMKQIIFCLWYKMIEMSSLLITRKWHHAFESYRRNFWRDMVNQHCYKIFVILSYTVPLKSH